MARTRLDIRVKRLEARARPSEPVAYAVPEITDEYIAEVWELLQTYGWYTSWDEWHAAWHDAVYGKGIRDDVAK